MNCYQPYDEVPQEVYENAKQWLESLGYDLKTEHTQMTPYRISWYIMSVLGNSRDIHITTFKNENPKIEDMVIVPRISIWSACSHHLLPFFGYADFGYIPQDRVIGLSKIPLLIKEMARGPWMQEHLCNHIADSFQNALEPQGVMVALRCQHTCMMLDLDSGEVPEMITSAIRGVFREEDGASRKEFLSLTGNF